MRNRCIFARTGLIVVGVIGTVPVAVSPAGAHCDTLDGPVVVAARAAVEKGDVTPVLMWVKKEHEEEIRAAFAKTIAVRAKGPEARDLADMYFFETVVRVHREGEGAPYSGLEPAGTDPGPAVAGADRAIANGSVDDLVSLLTEESASGIRERFRRVLEAKEHRGESVAAGRKYVEAYVELVHYAERLFDDSVSDTAHRESKEVTR